VTLPLLTERQISAPADQVKSTNVSVWPRLRQELTELERYVLGRVAIHTCNHDGAIPYIAPNAYQFSVALALAAPDVRALLASTRDYASFRQVSFRLSRVGWRLVRRLFRLTPLEEVMEREIKFDRLRTLMRDVWEGGEFV
jgi:hypothetical protein